jgi:hypothetical protein
VACNFGHHAILLDVKANFAKRGTPIQSQNSHDGSSLIVVLKKSSAGQQHADTAHPLALLRPRRKRPRSRATEQRDELAADHSITSSARASSAASTSRPSALAVYQEQRPANTLSRYATERKVRNQLAKGVGILKVARSLGIGTGTVQRIAKEVG